MSDRQLLVKRNCEVALVYESNDADLRAPCKLLINGVEFDTCSSFKVGELRSGGEPLTVIIELLPTRLEFRKSNT